MPREAKAGEEPDTAVKDDLTPEEKAAETAEEISSKAIIPDDRAAIYASAAQEREDEVNEVGDETNADNVAELKHQATGVRPSDDDAPDESATAEDEAEEVELVVDSNAETDTIRVYGQDIEVSQEQIDQAGGKTELQKQVAADVRMQRVSTYEAKLRSWDTDLQEREARLKAAAEAPTDTPPAAEETGNQKPPAGATGEIEQELLETVAEKLVTGVFSGSEAEAKKQVAEALSEVLSGRNQQVSTPTEDELVDKTLARLRDEGQISSPEPTPQTDPEVVEANRVFAEEYPHLTFEENPDAYAAAEAQLQRVTDSPLFADASLNEIVREACDRTDKMLKGEPLESLDIRPTDTEKDMETQIVEGRLVLKRRTRVPVGRASAPHTPAPEPKSKPESGSDFVRKQRELRNQPVT